MNAINKSSSSRDRARPHAWKCDCCRRSFYDVQMAPCLRDTVWAQLARKADTLCVQCCFKRAFERGVGLTRASLQQCDFNRLNHPWSYFDVLWAYEKYFEKHYEKCPGVWPHVYEWHLAFWYSGKPENRVRCHVEISRPHWSVRGERHDHDRCNRSGRP
jgi:hypothetical protein